MNRKMLVGSLLLVGGVVIAAFAATQSSKPTTGAASSEKHDEVSSSASTSASKGRVDRKARPTRDLAKARSFAYDVSATRRLGAPGATTPTSVTEISGSLSFTVVGASTTDDGEGAVLRVALSSPSRKDTPTRPASLDALSTPFFVVVRADGALKTWYFPRAMPGESRRQLRSIVSSMQLVENVSDRSVASWERTELDEAGQVVTFYETTSPDMLTKKKLRYDLLRGPEGMMPVSNVGKYDVTGKTTIALDSSGWPASLDEDITTTATFQGGQLAMTSLTRVRLVSSGEARQYVGSFEASQASFDPDPDAIAEDVALANRNADDGLVKGATLASLVTDYESAKEKKGRNRAVARLGALLRTTPDSVAEARKRMLDASTKETTARAIASALGAAGSKEAQKALADAVLDPKIPSSVKEDAVISLGLTDKPTAEAKAALKTASTSKDDVGASATLALGNMANQLGKEGGNAKDIVESLLARLEAATTSDEKVLLLDAIGNAADPRALPAIKARLADPDPSVRAAATSALRFQRSEEGSQLLVLQAGSPELHVRRAALAAMAQHEVRAVFAGLANIVKDDPNVELRKSAVRILAHATETSSEVVELLSYVSQHDADDDVKAAAASALAPRAK